MYLQKPALRATLADICRAASGGGGVVFDYVGDPADLPPAHRAVFDDLAERAARLGEPWVSYFSAAELSRELRAIGFGGVEDLDGAELNCRYFVARSDGLRVGSLGHIAIARSSP